MRYKCHNGHRKNDFRDTDTTSDLARFGARERWMLIDLLTIWDKEGLPIDNDRVWCEFNLNSGNVFLVNNQYEVAMMNGDNLEKFYSCGECGTEGFKDELTGDGNNECCQEMFK